MLHKSYVVAVVFAAVAASAMTPPTHTKHGLKHSRNPWDPETKVVTDPAILNEITSALGPPELLRKWADEFFAMAHNYTAAAAVANAKGKRQNLPSIYCQKAQFFADVYCGGWPGCANTATGGPCPYVWGGADGGCCSDGGGLDCSGLVYVSYNDAGWNGVGRTTYDQIAQTGPCPDCAAWYLPGCEAGDLFFYCFEQPCPSHVVMYAGQGYVTECPYTGANCHVVPAYTDSFQGCGRYCDWS